MGPGTDVSGLGPTYGAWGRRVGRGADVWGPLMNSVIPGDYLTGITQPGNRALNERNERNEGIIISYIILLIIQGCAKPDRTGKNMILGTGPDRTGPDIFGF